MKFPWKFHEVPWSFEGVSMEVLWSSVEFTWGCIEVPSLFHGVSMEIPWSFHEGSMEFA